MMKFRIILLSLALIFIPLVLLTGCFKQLPLEEVQACEFDSDCIQVFSPDCCKCPMAINARYLDYWDKLTKHLSKGCEGAVCDPCPPKAIGTQCKEGVCVMTLSPVGITNIV